MGTFDDLIPASTSAKKPAATVPAGGAFDDLIPAGTAAAPPRPARTQARSAAKPEASKPSLFGIGSDFTERTGLSQFDLAWPALKDTFGSRQGAAETIAAKVGGRVDVDADGDPVVVLKDGTRYRLNDPGLDSTDIASFTSNALAFLLPAGAAAKVAKAKNVGLLGRSALQAGAAGATDAGLQAAFDGGRIDPTRVALSAGGGAVGEVLGTGLNRLAPVMSRALGRAPTDAQAAWALARETGIPPTPERLSRLTEGMKEVRAGADPRAIAGHEEFGFVYTQGQRMTDPVRKFAQLSREELLRQRPGGNAPFEQASRTNQRQLEEALTNIGERLGSRPGATPAELAQGAAARLSAQADELGGRISKAYEEAAKGGRTAISVEAVRELPQRLREAVRDFAIDFTPGSGTSLIYPATAGALRQINRATNAILKSAEGGRVTGVTLKALETQRRILMNSINAATTKADRAAMTAIKREFDGWMDEAVESALRSGDPQALQALKTARGLRAEYGRRFEGKEEADRFIAGLLEGTRTPEELVNIALGASQVSKAGGARFIERLRQAADGDPKIIGNLRAAHFLRLTRGANGEPLNMGQIVRNIRTTEYSNASIVKALYTPEEWAQIRRLAAALDPLVAKGDFARTSGTAERMARMLFTQVGGGIPLVGEMAKGVDSVVAAVKANRAVNQPLRLRAPGSSAALPAAGAAAGKPIDLTISGGRVGPWTAADDEDLMRRRAEAEALRRQVEGR